MFRHHPVLTAATALYLAGVAWITLGPQPVALVRAGGIWKLLALLQRHSSTAWIHYSTVEFSANVLMFVPIGLFLLLLFGRRLWWFAVIMGVLLSSVIEFTQLYLPGRVSDVRDLASNSLGALIGVLVALVITWPAAARRRKERARALALAQAQAQARAQAHARSQASPPRTGDIRVA
jgi:glycopeptide antibiotics resistance protein